MQHAEAVQTRHHHVEHDQVRIRFGDRGERGVAVVGGQRLEAVEAERGGDEVGHVLFVVDDENPTLGCRGCAHKAVSLGVSMLWLCRS